MNCPMCKKYYEGAEVPKNVWNTPADEWCPACVSAAYKSDLARHRASQIHYHKELVTIGKGEFECSGYHQDNRLWDEEITVNGADVYGLLSPHVEAQIYEEICRRVVSGEICRRCEEIEKELPDSQDPASLRLERSELDGELKKIEEVAG